MALWQALGAGANPSTRAQLVDHYLPFARMFAAKLYAKRTYAELEFMDYMQFASIGLIESIDRYDVSLGVPFEGFAAPRIGGAILNGIESLSEKQKQVGARKRIVKERIASSTDSNAGHNGTDALFAYLAEIAIGLAVGFALEDSGMYQSEAPSYPDNTYHGIELRQLRQRIRTMVDTLPGNEQRVIRYHYLQQLAFDEVAVILGLSKGRVSQLHQQAIRRLRLGVGSDGEIDLRC